MRCPSRKDMIATLFGTFFLAAPAFAAPGDATVTWTTEVVDSVASAPANVLGKPDGEETGITYVRVRRFTKAIPYSGLAKFLGVANKVLARSDIIAFEFNGGHPASGGGWESSTWFFSDGSRAYAETFDETTGVGTIASGRRAKFATGNLTGVAYETFFGLAPGSSSPNVSWILINVPDDIDVHSRDFFVWLGNADVHPGSPGDEGTPDPEAIGVLRHGR